MGTQLHHKHAQKRLEEKGIKHWFDAKTMPHPRQDLQELFDKYLEEALAANYNLENYIPNEQYGNYVKESQEGYTGNQWTRN